VNACNSQTFRGRPAELRPFEIKAAEAAKGAARKATAAWYEVSTDNVSAEELYGCVDWYQYPEQGEREREDKAKCVGEH